MNDKILKKMDRSNKNPIEKMGELTGGTLDLTKTTGVFVPFSQKFIKKYTDEIMDALLFFFIYGFIDEKARNHILFLLRRRKLYC